VDKETFLEGIKDHIDELEEHLQEGMAASSLLVTGDLDWDPAAVVLALGEFALSFVAVLKEFQLFYEFLGGKPDGPQTG